MVEIRFIASIGTTRISKTEDLNAAAAEALVRRVIGLTAYAYAYDHSFFRPFHILTMYFCCSLK